MCDSVESGYVIVNEDSPRGSVVCDDAKVYSDRKVAEKVARRLSRQYDNPSINVYELVTPGILYSLSEEDVFEIAKEKRVSRKRVRERMDHIRKGIEEGLYDWAEVVGTAIDLAMKDE